MVEYNFHDIFVGILAYFPEGKDKFGWDDKLFKSFFYNKKKEYSILDFLAFDTDWSYPLSSQIDEGLATLRQSRLITCDMDFNPHFDEACKISFEEFVRAKLNGKELGELEKLSGEFYNKFGVSARKVL
jgi:hypothetical protein